MEIATWSSPCRTSLREWTTWLTTACLLATIAWSCLAKSSLVLRQFLWKSWARTGWSSWTTAGARLRKTNCKKRSAETTILWTWPMSTISQPREPWLRHGLAGESGPTLCPILMTSTLRSCPFPPRLCPTMVLPSWSKAARKLPDSSSAGWRRPDCQGEMWD